MLEETIGSYIDNIFKFLIFLGISLLVFLVLFLAARKTPTAGRKIRFYKKDPLLLKNLFILGLVTIMAILFLLVVSNIIILIVEFEAGPPLYMLAALLLNLLLMAAYIIKSRILNRGN